MFLVALRDHFQSSVALTAAVFSASGLFGAFVAPLLGVVLDRFGPRVLFPIAGCFILVGWLASSMVSEVWQLFIFYSVIATVGQVGISSFSATATLAPWFPRTRGVALGMADAGNPAGQAIVVPLAQLIVSTIGLAVGLPHFRRNFLHTRCHSKPAFSEAAAGRLGGNKRRKRRRRRRK